MNWMLHCANSSIPMVILEPKILAEIDYLDDSDKISNSSENPFGHAEQERFLFRFGIMASDLNFMTRLVCPNWSCVHGVLEIAPYLFSTTYQRRWHGVGAVQL